MYLPGGHMGPPGRDTARFPTMFGEYETPTTGGHTGPPLG